MIVTLLAPYQRARVIDGRSLLPVIENAATSWSTALFVQGDDPLGG
jgi:hypothetical protein